MESFASFGWPLTLAVSPARSQKVLEIDVRADHACIAYIWCMQYTLRGIPPAVDDALRERARVAGKSLNETAVAALAEGSGMAGAPRKRRDLRDIAGAWKAEKAVESALAAQDRVDEALWR